MDLTVPSEGVVVVGDNGHGKTNLLEAIYYLVLFRSFRGTADRDLVTFGEHGFHLDCALDNGCPETRRVSAGFDLRSHKKRVTVDRADVQRLGEAIGSLRAVILSPADRVLVAGSPSFRRRYLDIVLSLTRRDYLEALRAYRRALKQRNAALRRGRLNDAAAFEAVLARTGTVISEVRETWVAAWRDRFIELVQMIGEEGVPELEYDGSTEPVDYEATRHRDLERGMTLEGPHRDDLAIRLDGRRLGEVGSAGQQRTAAIALRLVESEAMEDPITLLDDAFAELDDRRQEQLAVMFEGRQCLLAVPREADVPPRARGLPRWTMTRGTIASA